MPALFHSHGQTPLGTIRTFASCGPGKVTSLKPSSSSMFATATRSSFTIPGA